MSSWLQEEEEEEEEEEEAEAEEDAVERMKTEIAENYENDVNLVAAAVVSHSDTSLSVLFTFVWC